MHSRRRYAGYLNRENSNLEGKEEEKIKIKEKRKKKKKSFGDYK